MVLVESSVWIDFLNGAQKPQVDRLDALLGERRIIVGDLVLTEVLQGFDSERDFRIARKLLSAFEQASLVTPELALRSARNYRFLRRAGHTVRTTVDCLIATWCIESGIALIHSDRDYRPFEEHLGLIAL